MDFQKDLLAEYDRETARTRKIFDAIPADVDWSYKPHEKSMSIGQLSGHITESSTEFPMMILTKDLLDFPVDHKWEPFIAASKTELLERFDKGLPVVRAAISATTPAGWDGNWKFIFGGTTFVDSPRHQVVREMVICHMIHHRAQLGVYLRLLGAKLPGTYGPSADGM